jgi:hypothetical protein
MMKILWITLIISSCAHRSPKVETNDVSIHSALMQAQASYLKGCVDALKEIKLPVTFETCRDKSLFHRKELEGIMNQLP